MKYTLDVPQNHSEIFCLYTVVDAIAKAKATEFGSLEFHHGTYDEVFRTAGEMLTKEVMNNRLQVFDSTGTVLTPEEIEVAKGSEGFHFVIEFVVKPDWVKLKQQYPEREIASGCWDWVGIDLGETKPNKFSSLLHYLHTSLQSINDWGKASGKQFELNEFPVDMKEFGPKNMSGELAYRGFFGRSVPETKTDTDGDVPKGDGKVTSNWKLLVQAEAATLWRALKGMGCSPTRNSIKDDLAKICRDKGIKTDHDIHPTAEYIYRHVLGGWTPPTD